MATKSSLLPLIERFFELDPMAAAHTLESMKEEEAVEVLKVLPVPLAVTAVGHLPAVPAADLISHLPPERFRDIVSKLNPQHGATIFLRFSKDMRQRYLAALDEQDRKDIQELLTYPENSAGRIMATDFLAYHTDIKVKDAIQKIRQLASRGFPASYVYVMDKDSRLAGVVNMRDLMLASLDAPLEEIMRKDVFSVNCFTDREIVADELSSRKYFAAPVVDQENRLIGVVHAEHLIDDVQEEATEDIQKMVGAGGDERAFSPIFFSLKKRLPWLHVNLATAFLAAWIVALFEDLIAKITVLAIFLPVVAGQGGNAGSQSLAVVMRGIVMREIPAQKAKSLVLKETWIGLINGIVFGAITAVLAWLWQRSPYLGLVIGLGMLVNLIIAGFSGAAIPLVMKRLGMDPAQCSSIILTTITDVMGFLAFLSVAVLFQKHLIPS